MKSSLLLFLLLIRAASSLQAGVPIKSAKAYLYILLHGEDGKDATESFRLFTDGPQGGIKGILEKSYGLEGHVFACQMANPSGSLYTWTRAFGDPDDPNSVVNRVRHEYMDYLRTTLDITDTAALNAGTPREFIVVAHSFGGIAVRNYICSPYYRGDIKMLITINSPHSGSDYPYVMEVLETRTALKRVTKMAAGAWDKAGAGNAIKKAVETAFQLKKTYDTAEELFSDLRKYRKIIGDIRNKIDSAESRMKSCYPDISFADIPDTLKATVNKLQSLPKEKLDISIDPEFLDRVKNACIAWKATCRESGANYLESPAVNKKRIPIRDLCITLKAMEDAGAGNLKEMMNDAGANEELARSMFSPDDFKQVFAPESFKPGNYIRADAAAEAKPAIRDYGRVFAGVECAIQKPNALFSGNVSILNAYEDIRLLRSCVDSMDQDASRLKNLAPPAFDSPVFKELEENSLVVAIRNFNDVRTAFEALNEMPDDLNFGNCLMVCGNFFVVLDALKKTFQGLDEINLYTDWDKFTECGKEIRRCFSSPKIKETMNQVLALRKYQRAFSALQRLKIQKEIALTLTPGTLACNISMAAEFPVILANINISGQASAGGGAAFNLPSGYSSLALERTTAFLGLLNSPKIDVALLAPLSDLPLLPNVKYPAKPDLPSLSDITDCPLKVPDVLDAYRKVAVLVESINDCAAALKQAADIYYEVKTLSQNIRDIVKTLKGKGSDPDDKAREIFGAGSDILSSLLIGMCISKALGPAENPAASSASFSVIAKKFAAELQKSLWKEIRNGAILEVGFAEAALSATGVRAADPTMAAVSNDESIISGLRDAMPSNYPDTALNQSKYRIIYTSGVLTPTKNGTRPLDFVCGSGGTKALVRGKIQAEIEKAIDKVKTELADKMIDRVDKEIAGATEAAKKAMTDGLKPGGNFAAAVDSAKKCGQFDRYRSLIEGCANTAINNSMDELADVVSGIAGDMLDQVGTRLKDMESLQKGMNFLDKLNPGMVVSIYKTISSADKELSVGQDIFALYYSPLLKLGLYGNGDFFSTKESQMGNDIRLFRNAQDVKRYQCKVSDPLGPFEGIAALGLGMDAAYYLSLALFPASAEPIRITKISAVNLLSIAVAVAKQKELGAYFSQGHKMGITVMADRAKLDDMLFDKPWVSIRSPDGE